MERMPFRREKITTNEANVLRRDIVAGGFGDNTDSAEMITKFLADRGYAVNRESMLDLIRSANQGSLEEFRKKLGENALEN